MSKKDIQMLLAGYFGASMKSMDVSIVSGLAEVEVMYVDFHPIPVVRKYLCEHIGRLHNVTLERLYSTELKQDALLCLYNERMDIQEEVEKILFDFDVED